MKSLCLAFTLAVLAGCAAPPGGVYVEGSVLHVDLGEFTTPAGDTLTCFSTGFVTDREYAVGGSMGTQAEGGHHLTIYWTMDPTEFDPRPCRDEDMTSWNFIAGTGGEAGTGDDQSPPDGLAFRVPAGAHIVVQAHYINVSGAARSVRDTLEVELVDPATLVAFAAMYAVNDGSFEIPPRVRYRRVSECTFTERRELVMILGHMHEAGRFFHSELLRAGTTTPETLYSEEWTDSYVAHPPVTRWPIEAPLVIEAGDRLRMTCEWENVGADPLIFPSEMCTTVAYYFPDLGEGFIACDTVTISSETL
jgi:hypothetical protein